MKFRFLLSYLSTGLFILLTFVILGTALPFKANAYSQGDILIDMTPENPSPNINTTISLTSYAYDLNSVPISWSANGKKSLSGVGQKSFSINAPSLGKSITVTAEISLPDGDATLTETIKPSIMVLLWEANDSYVPPFYKGKAMPSPNSEIKVVSLPEIKSSSGFVNPQNMTYSWQLDSTNNQEGSGYGKNFFLYTSDYLDNSNNVTVTATTLDQKYSTDGSLDVTTTDPKIEFYKNDPTLGTIWDQALLDGHKVIGNEIVQAAPYFISPKDFRIPFLTFDWSVNGTPVNVPILSKNLLPLTIQSGTSGTAKIGLNIDSTTSLVETVNKEISVQF